MSSERPKSFVRESLEVTEGIFFFVLQRSRKHSVQPSVSQSRPKNYGGLYKRSHKFTRKSIVCCGGSAWYAVPAAAGSLIRARASPLSTLPHSPSSRVQSPASSPLGTEPRGSDSPSHPHRECTALFSAANCQGF